MASLASVMGLVAACGQKAARLRPCVGAAEADSLVRTGHTLLGASEYDLLQSIGKPTRISMNRRSEKEYYYAICPDTQADTHRLVLRFTGIGRCKEVFVE